MQRLTITFEWDGGKSTASYEQPDLIMDDLFWAWFVPVWATLGLESITKDLQEKAG